MREMQTIVTDDPSVCLSGGSTRLHCAKMAERIKMLFVTNTRGGPRNIVLDESPDPPTERGRRVGENLANYGPSAYLMNS